MGLNILDWFTEDNDDIVVKSLSSKGMSKELMEITIGDVRKGKVKDSLGYENEVVLFLRKNESQRPKPAKRKIIEETDSYKLIRIEK